MHPYGYTCSKTSPDSADQTKGGNLAAAALLAKYNTAFQHGDICNTIYQASGSSVDWTYEAASVKYSYAVELRDTGSYGFTLPAKFIIPSGEETLAGVVALWRFAASQA